jgi:hypothetical protein
VAATVIPNQRFDNFSDRVREVPALGLAWLGLA